MRDFSNDDLAWAKVALRTVVARCVRSVLAELQRECEAWMRRA